jgi:hypothetical protein
VKNERIAGYATIFTTQKPDKKTSQFRGYKTLNPLPFRFVHKVELVNANLCVTPKLTNIPIKPTLPL